MSILIDSYRNVSKQLQVLKDKITTEETKIEQLSASFSGDSSVRIAKLEEQLVKIDEYLLKIKGFQELAKRNLDSQNVLTIEAPPGYRVNLNRLRNWAMMIDPQSSNDPYAQRVFVVAKCDECFLNKKQVEFSERIAQLKADQVTGTNAEIEEHKRAIETYRSELNQYALSEEVAAFGRDVVAENQKFWHNAAPTAYAAKKEMPATIAPGAYAAPFAFEYEQRRWLKTAMGDFYDVDGGRVLLPVEISNTQEYVMTITCTPSKRKKLDKALQNLVLTTINENPVGTHKVYVLDAVRFNSASMGSLRALESSCVMEQIPRNPDQLTATLEQIVSGFADTDEILELHDSVSEYNASVDPAKQIPLSTIIVFGWPNSFAGRDRELLQRIMTNYERYGISLVVVTYQNSVKKSASEKENMPEYAMQNAIQIVMTQSESTITLAGGAPQHFTWYSFNGELSSEYVDSLLKNQTVKETVGNEYIKRYSLTERPTYVREYKKIELPFGIDGKDQAHSLSFENENFATYLVGASRSGKSTLLHTLIAGLIRNYHPDNVELWLADFKQLEFKRYIKHLPPHVKYVLLDESTELVFDLIDKLTAEMMERQKLFARLGKQRIDQVDTTKLDQPLPVIFVILDEFSIMSQSIAESPIYKLRLQNILAKGAALGIKFLFSSQTFTTGVAGLTATARAQIQQRIAMKGTKEEISETLELSANLKTEQVRNWMDALPPHYALVKFRISADTLPQVKRFLVMYFKDYAPRDEMIDSIRNGMHVVDKYTPTDMNSYTDKHPVLVDGNTFDAFDNAEFMTHVHDLKTQSQSDLSGEEMFVSFGTPRLMVRTKTAALSSETRENILLISRSAEQACAASILLSAAKSFSLQGGQVEIWAYSKNRLYRAYKQAFASAGIHVVEDLDAVCDAISKLKTAITNKETANKLIVLIGIERICMDFDYVDSKSRPDKVSSKPAITDVRKGFEASGAVVSSDEDERRQKYGQAWALKRINLKREAKAAGKTEEEIKVFLAEEEAKFREEYGANFETATREPTPKSQEPLVPVSAPMSDEKTSSAYNAQDDLVYVIKQGSRLGYHFMAQLNTFADIKQCGFKPDFFRYKLAFQLSVEDSRGLFNNKVASTLPEHICQFDDSLERYSFRPYLHYGVGWEGWYVDENGVVVSPYSEGED